MNTFACTHVCIFVCAHVPTNMCTYNKYLSPQVLVLEPSLGLKYVLHRHLYPLASQNLVMTPKGRCLPRYSRWAASGWRRAIMKQFEPRTSADWHVWDSGFEV